VKLSFQFSSVCFISLFHKGAVIFHLGSLACVRVFLGVNGWSH
jgi:hypothetical protein